MREPRPSAPTTSRARNCRVCPVSVACATPAHPLSVVEELSDGVPKDQLDARRLGGHLANQRIEAFAAKVMPSATCCGRRVDPTPPRPRTGTRANRAGLHHWLDQTHSLQRAHTRRLDVVRADPLEGAQIRALPIRAIRAPERASMIAALQPAGSPRQSPRRSRSPCRSASGAPEAGSLRSESSERMSLACV